MTCVTSLIYITPANFVRVYSRSLFRFQVAWSNLPFGYAVSSLHLAPPALISAFIRLGMDVSALLLLHFVMKHYCLREKSISRGVPFQFHIFKKKCIKCYFNLNPKYSSQVLYSYSSYITFSWNVSYVDYTCIYLDKHPVHLYLQNGKQLMY